jgi:hypothetical protein
LLDRFYDLLEHSFCISNGVVVPETQDTKAAAPQVGVSRLVSCALGVLTAIRLDSEHSFERHEVNDPRSERHLPAEFYICELPRTKELPKLLLCVCQCMTKVACLAPLEFVDSILRHFPLTRLAHFVRAAPSATRGDG